MRTAGFQAWLRQVAHLTRRQRDQLFAALRPAVDLDRACATIEQARPDPACPTCGGCRTHRHGVQRGLQRYRCCACGRTFNARTGTPLARLRYRERWLPGLGGMLEGKSVRATADALGVHRNTAFRWRHRFLHLAKHDRPASLTGIAEADELYVLESQKGSKRLDRPPRTRGGVARRRGIDGDHVCVLVARDRSGATFDFVTGRAAVTCAQLQQHLLPVLDPDVLLVTDGHAAYQSFARKTGISHEALNLRKGERTPGRPARAEMKWTPPADEMLERNWRVKMKGGSSRAHGIKVP
ncbi:IS1595 family transposase [Massilia yuzhufengensis]|uniref:Transposase n=1 Tax=Massilia yuzhufengensis TaxID=1164594 RepID=A0A1I1PXB3_9BURK|nr:IS1595 family transposase [Massilia yuzhufengensis]SFD14425.1 Transposase [Massilia yuzhufengensis]